MNRNNLDKLITEALAIEEKEAKEAGALGYMARMLVLATLPHRRQEESSFVRTNGKFRLAIMGHPDVGLPYGVYPRLLLAWIVTEAVLTQEPTLILGGSLSQFMSKIGLIPSGGRWGTISRLRDQMKKLFSASVSCIYEDKLENNGINFNFAKEYHLWWHPKMPNQADLWQSTVTLGQDFFNEIIKKPVPIDLRAIKALKSSSMALDLYCWLTYRLSYLQNQIEIPWSLLQRQFGANYNNTKQGRHDFKRGLLHQLKKVATIYEGATKVKEGSRGIILNPSRSHIRMIR